MHTCWWCQIEITQDQSVKMMAVRAYEKINYLIYYLIIICFNLIYYLIFNLIIVKDSLVKNSRIELNTRLHIKYYYPAPGRGTGYCFRAISFFLSFFLFFVSNITRKRLDRFAWNFQGRCALNLGSIRVNGSTGQRSICLLSPAIAQRTGVNKSVSFARWQHCAGFVVPHPTACSSWNKMFTVLLEKTYCIKLNFMTYACIKLIRINDEIIILYH